MSTRKNQFSFFFEKCFQKLSLSTQSTLTLELSSTRFPAVTRLTVHRRRQFQQSGRGRRAALWSALSSAPCLAIRVLDAYKLLLEA
eukprot:8343566-Pyramimonas_sp.AAC.1